jgi:hypothetical protein
MRIEISTIVTVQDEVEGCSFALNGDGDGDGDGDASVVILKE